MGSSPRLKTTIPCLKSGEKRTETSWRCTSSGNNVLIASNFKGGNRENGRFVWSNTYIPSFSLSPFSTKRSALSVLSMDTTFEIPIAVRGVSEALSGKRVASAVTTSSPLSTTSLFQDVYPSFFTSIEYFPYGSVKWRSVTPLNIPFIYTCAV